MPRFIARRILELIPVLFIIATVTFFMTRMAPGGPFDSEKNTTPEIRKAIEAYYGLDKPLIEQYLHVIKGYLKGDLGPDYKYPNRSVQELILGAFPVSLELAEGNQLTRCGLSVVGCPAVQDFRENGRPLPIVIQAGAAPHLLRLRPR